MTVDEMATIVREWFGRVEMAYGPVLPDGWFGGRPYENGCRLERIDTLAHALTIHMSGWVSLTFYRPRAAAIDNNGDLVIRDFDSATLKWDADGSTKERRYTPGEVRLVPPLGVRGAGVR